MEQLPPLLHLPNFLVRFPKLYVSMRDIYIITQPAGPFSARRVHHCDPRCAGESAQVNTFSSPQFRRNMITLSLHNTTHQASQTRARFCANAPQIWCIYIILTPSAVSFSLRRDGVAGQSFGNIDSPIRNIVNICVIFSLLGSSPPGWDSLKVTQLIR